MLSLLTFALLAASPGGALTHARAHLAQHQPAALVFDLDDEVALTGNDAAQAASLLVKAGALAQRQGDGVLALTLAQMARRRAPRDPAPLQLLGELALSARDDAEAERWCAGWQALEPESPQPGLLRLRIAADEGDWDTVGALSGSLADDARLTSADRERARSLEQVWRARQPKPTSDPQAEALERAAQAAAIDRQATLAARDVRASGVVVYGASWCVWCKRALAYFKSKGIAVQDVDIERDPDARREMIEKLRAAGKSPNGIPVIDVRGTIIQGFDQPLIEKALAR